MCLYGPYLRIAKKIITTVVYEYESSNNGSAGEGVRAAYGIDYFRHPEVSTMNDQELNVLGWRELVLLSTGIILSPCCESIVRDL